MNPWKIGYAMYSTNTNKYNIYWLKYEINYTPNLNT